MPPTQLLAKPRTPKKHIATKIVEITTPWSKTYIYLALATIVGIRGVKPNKEKEKKVTMLFLMGLYSPAINCSSSIIMILRKPYGFLLKICTISSATGF